MSRGGSRGSSPSGQHRRCGGWRSARPGLRRPWCWPASPSWSRSSRSSAPGRWSRRTTPRPSRRCASYRRRRRRAGHGRSDGLAQDRHAARRPDRPSRRPAGQRRAETAGLPDRSALGQRDHADAGRAECGPVGGLQRAAQLEIAYRTALATNSTLVKGSMPDGNPTIEPGGHGQPPDDDVPDRGDAGDRAAVQPEDRIGAAADSAGPRRPGHRPESLRDHQARRGSARRSGRSSRPWRCRPSRCRGPNACLLDRRRLYRPGRGLGAAERLSGPDRAGLLVRAAANGA